MSGRIYDEFTHEPLTRQRKYQLRKAKLGRCITCGGRSGGSIRCTECNSRVRKYEKEYRAAKAAKRVEPA